MALRAPNPLLATETVTVVSRAPAKDVAGGSKLITGATADYAAIVTMQIVNHEAMVAGAGGRLSKALWDVILFSASDPLVNADDWLVVQGQGRTLVATKRSTYREAGAWYVLCQSIE